MPNRVLTMSALSFSAFALAACGDADRPSDTVRDAPESLGKAASLTLACTGCHSDDSGAIVSLTAYSELALQEALDRYKSETEGSTVMHRLARGYTDDEIALISAYLGAGDAGN